MYQNEQQWLQNARLVYAKNNNLFLVNDRIGCDTGVGNYTFRNMSVLDYCIVSLNMFEFYQDFEVVEMDTVSWDHFYNSIS